MLLIRPTRTLDLDDSFGRDLLELSAESQRVCVAVEELCGRGVVLGRHVSASRVIGSRTADFTRRVSSGPAFFLDRGVYVGIAIPSVDHQFKDATPRNLLNRNVRPMIAALRACGLHATYLGRDWISVVAGGERRALFGIGYEGLATGEILFEFYASLSSDLRIPSDLASDLELATKRFGGRPTVAFRDIGEVDAFVPRLRATLVDALSSPSEPEELTLGPTAHAIRDPGTSVGAPLEVPIGWLDAFEDGGVGGDLLCASWVLDQARHTSTQPDNALLDGATWADVMCVKLRA